jgi:GLPGLI family protein
MKKLIILLILTSSQFSFSQITEGYFQYSIDAKAVDTTLKIRQTAAMMIDSKMALYFADSLSRVDMKMGKAYTTSITIDKKRNRVLTVTTGAIGNTASVHRADDVIYQDQLPDTAVHVELIDEDRVILGLNCKKAIMTTDGKRTTYWYTKDIKVKASSQTIVNPNIPGFPVSISGIEGGLEMNFELSNYYEGIPDKEKIFSTIPPEGFIIKK